MSADAATRQRASRGLDARTLARLARRTPEPLLRAAVMPPTRSLVVAEIFRRMPRQLRAKAGAPDAVIRWDIGYGKGDAADTWFAVFEGGACRTSRRHEGALPRTTITVSALDFVRMASGAANPMELWQQGRLKISGDLFFAAQLQSMFTIPA